MQVWGKEVAEIKKFCRSKHMPQPATDQMFEMSVEKKTY